MSRFPSLLCRSVARGREYLVDCARIDTRSLAVFRVFVGLLVVADVFLRARNFSFYYTDSGVVTQALAQADTHEYAVSVYYLTSDTTLIAALLALQVFIALALVVGYRTRTATALTFLFVISLDHHNPFVLSYADTLFRLLLFWAPFLPLGERWAVDAVHAARTPRQSVVGAATFLALAQMVFMYLLNGIHKTESEAWQSGEATPLIFGIDEMTFLLGEFLGAFPTLLTYGGLLWFYMLLGSWLLFFLRGRLRLPLVALFVGGHLSFALTVRIGAFAYVALAGLVFFLQTPFWRDAGRLLRRLGIDTAGVVPRDRLYRFADTLPALRLLSGRYAVIRTGAYNAALAAVLVALALVCAVFLFNAGAIVDDGYEQSRLNHEVEHTTGGEYVHTVAAGLGIRQPEWSVFAPHPRTNDRYYVFGAKTVDGQERDVYNDRAFTWDRPEPLQEQHDTYRERFFMNSVRRAGDDAELPGRFGEHICTVYEEQYGIELTHISMFEVTEDITLETITDTDSREDDREHFYRHDCD
ncbi:VKGC domain protein [Natronomonas pharaonis DSM 2160]|uniref:VKGC domain protein n=1 Tax=Natronomonas pharaonis (strain ATCC 35678 / DSM 2160 / CIP 103997 / JCM 8858 / NBRC 14720 / NCIMB 2260 / Gabara) TaxID=348780 RepID=A0A1U7EYY4_NATPD|nr:HTTM domain-containing protein [Natronomonas pharaonis]CAI50453.1 VKGC domain protein [Natronomonas pharaonis DSM 2160]